MSPEHFRRIALQMDGASEGAHMGHADFRVCGKIFATLGFPDDDSAVVVLTPEEQKAFIRTAPRVFSPVKGRWGLRGNTHVALPAADAATVRKAIKAGWKTHATKPTSKQKRIA